VFRRLPRRPPGAVGILPFRRATLGATGDAATVNSSFVDRAVSEGVQRDSWFTMARVATP